MDKVRLGMIGSQFSAHLHLNNYAKMRGLKVEVVGIASKTEINAQQTAQKFNIPSVYTDYRQLLERKDVDAVDLCVPTHLHEEMILGQQRQGNISFVRNP